MNQAIGLVRTYLERVPHDEPRPEAVEARLEAPLVDPLTGEDLGIPLVGIVDLVLSGSDGPVICDFKTTRKANASLEVMHEIQLSCYAYLYRRVAQTREAGLEIRSLVKNKMPKIEFHRYESRESCHWSRLFAVIRAYLEDLRAGRYFFRPGLMCPMCDFRERRCQLGSVQVGADV